MKKTKFDNIFMKGKNLYTLNFSDRVSNCDKVIKAGNKEFRFWDPKRSKLAAFILKNADQIGVREKDRVLYLGASTGTTASHISDVVREGMVFALEFSPVSMRKLFYVCKSRKNMAPILADANNPGAYKSRVSEVDYIYQDIAQRNQVEILFKNTDAFLKKGGFCIICVKSRSIDAFKKPSQVFKEVKKQISSKLEIVDNKTLEPFQKDHCIILCKKKS